MEVKPHTKQALVVSALSKAKNGATMQDLAKAADCSVGTVAYIIRELGSLVDKTESVTLYTINPSKVVIDLTDEKVSVTKPRRANPARAKVPARG